ncbi:MAG TPA: cache domain-containing protein, partial [Anaerolineales bacterium]|nr:cache domain-containing protein [Anaerolineales bacterium]
QAAEQRLAVFDGGVVLLDARGRVRATLPHRPGLIAHDWSDRDFYQQVLGEAEMAVSDAQLVARDEPYVVVIAVPIRGEGNTFVGSLAGMFRLGTPTLSAFYASIVRLRVGQTGSTYVADGKGRIVFDSESERVGRFITSSQLSMIAPPVPYAQVTEDEEGNDVISAWARVPGTEWTLVVEDDWTAVTSSIGRYRDVLALSFVAALLLPPLGMMLLTRQRRFRLPDIRPPEHDDGWLKTVREHLRPRQLPVMPGWHLVARQVDGKSADREFFDACLLPDGRLMLSLGKIPARGIQSAVTLASLRAVMRAAGQRLAGADETLRQSNAMLCAHHPPPLAVRCLYLLVEPTTGWLEYAAAGAVPPRARGACLVQDRSSAGQPIGTNPDIEIGLGQVQIEPGQVLVALGPSMLDVRDPDGEAFVHAPLDRAMEEASTGLQDRLGKIIDAFREFNAKSPYFEPDLTVVLLQRSESER